MWQYAFANNRMDELSAANEAGFSAMVVLANKWGVEVPAELLVDVERTEREWHAARNMALAEMDRNPPPFLRNQRKNLTSWRKAA
jgi:hypothetical protein